MLSSRDHCDRIGRLMPARGACRGQGQHDLERHVLPSAEGTSDGRIDHPDLIDRQIEGVGDLFLVLVDPLPGDLDGDPSLSSM